MPQSVSVWIIEYWMDGEWLPIIEHIYRDEYAARQDLRKDERISEYKRVESGKP